MKELIEKYKALALEAEKVKEGHPYSDFTGTFSNLLENLLEDLETLQSKGKTKEEAHEALRSLKSGIDTSRESDDGPDEVSWGMQNGVLLSRNQAESIFELLEEYAQSHANKDGWVSVGDAQRLLAIRDALIQDDIELAYHELRMLADPNTERNNHWENWEKIATNPPKPQI